MSQTPDQHEEEHTGPIKTPKQMLVVSVLSFLLPVLIIVGLVYFVTSAPQPSTAESSAEQVAQRIAKIGSVKLGVDPALRPQLAGEVVYKAQCATCHDSGLAGAPKLGDAAAWAPRLPAGLDALLHSAIGGKGGMAAQGGGDHTDFEIARAVVFMANRAGGSFQEPLAPAAPASAAEGGAAASSVPAVVPSAPAEAAASVVSAASASESSTQAAAAPAAKVALSPEVGKAVYEQSCQVCHVAGVAGAPKLGDKAAWEPRRSQGVDTLTAHVIAGKGAMPPRGASSASDEELHAAVQYMLDASK